MATTKRLSRRAGSPASRLGNAARLIGSLLFFASLWELAWWFGLADPLLLPPPHIFLFDVLEQGRYFSARARVNNLGAMQIVLAMATTIALTTARVFAGLLLAFVLSLVVGVAIKYFYVFGRLTLPIITMLAPISPVAWLPIAIFVIGIGNATAIFMVYIALFFIMTLSTVSELENIKPHYRHVARVMGATRWQQLLYVDIPAILPGLFLSLRLNMFAAWMIVFIGEGVGVGNGLGQVVMVARNSFNPSLTFFVMAVIGVLGYACDVLLRSIQARMLYWIPRQS